MTWNTGPWMEEKVQVVTGGGNTYLSIQWLGGL